MALPNADPSGAELAAHVDTGPESAGSRLRAERERQGIGLRELARRVKVSPSLISQVELGKARPSVGTLYGIVNELGISLDELFFDSAVAAGELRGREPLRLPDAAAGERRQLDASHPPTDAAELVVRRDERKAIQLDSGVRWERLTPVSQSDLDFLYVVYDVGGASCAEDSLMRHSGREYGHLIKGRLGVTVGFDTHELGPGDSISFDSTVPHRLFNAGTSPAEGIWFVTGRGETPA
jgi:transcriptional regulator with XRE-family HTH domain